MTFNEKFDDGRCFEVNREEVYALSVIEALYHIERFSTLQPRLTPLQELELYSAMETVTRLLVRIDQVEEERLVASGLYGI